MLAYPEFEPDAAERIDQFRSAHEPERAKVVPPHVTLMFGSRSAPPSEIISRCKSLAEQVSEFEVGLTTVEIVHDPFEKAHKLFLICTEGRRTLISLHEQLYDGPHRAELSPDHPYRPHMTVATNRRREVIELLDLAELGTFPIRGMIRALEVVDFTDGTLRPLQAILLRS
ncbi:2'-5' RNA ligase family protein [Tabrizicola sp.]|uniref:2'-5' RNA ligase family protein n=1 Tax=Tabrizicola sp. TaxID=2005166 RepID=UPI003F2A666C